MSSRANATCLAALGLLAGCAVDGPGYGGYAGVDVAYVDNYWEPWGYDYGGWGGRYYIGPPPGDRGHGYGEHPGGHFGGDGDRPSGHFGGGRGGRPAPSIPGRPR